MLKYYNAILCGLLISFLLSGCVGITEANVLSIAKEYIEEDINRPFKWRKEEVLEVDQHGRHLMYFIVEGENIFGATVREDIYAIVQSHGGGHYSNNRYYTYLFCDGLEDRTINLLKNLNNWDKPPPDDVEEANEESVTSSDTPNDIGQDTTIKPDPEVEEDITVEDPLEKTIENVEKEPEITDYSYLLDQTVVVNIDNEDELVLRGGPGEEYRETFEITGGIRLKNGEKLLVKQIVNKDWLIVKRLTDEHFQASGFVHVDNVEIPDDDQVNTSVPDGVHDGDYTTKVFVDVSEETYLNLRSGPGTDYEVIGHLGNNTVLKIIGGSTPSEDEIWLQVIIPDGKKGWVSGDYVNDGPD